MNHRLENEQAVERTLGVHAGALGDVVLFAHLLARLDAEVTLAAGRAKAELLANMRRGARAVVACAIDFDALPLGELFADAPPEQCRLPGLLGRHERLVSCYPGEGDRRAQLRLAAACGARSILPQVRHC